LAQADVLDLVRTGFSGLVVVGFVLGFFQLRAALRSSRANVLLRMIQEYSSPEVYGAVRYIHQLRREWKAIEPNPSSWQSLADQWVKDHATAADSADSPEERRRASEWLWRRTASQFVSKMGYMMIKGYVGPDDLFSVVPEMPRLLLVLAPIERAVCEHFEAIEPAVAEWDAPFDKLVFESIDERYLKWYKRTGSKHMLRRRRS